MEEKKLTIKNETCILRDTIYGMMREIKEKIEQGYSIKSVYKTYEKDEEFPYHVKLEFIKDDE